jgi:hypothetical protein
MFWSSRNRFAGSYCPTRRLGKTSKKADTYLRVLLIHGVRSVLTRAKTIDNPDRLRCWATTLEAARGLNKAAVALANKLARNLWAVWKNDVPFESKTARGLQGLHRSLSPRAAASLDGAAKPSREGSRRPPGR